MKNLMQKLVNGMLYLSLLSLVLVSCENGQNQSTDYVFLEKAVEEADMAYEYAEAEEAVSEDLETMNNFNTEEYDHIVENIFEDVKTSPLSTFSIDVDNASYSNVRRFLMNNSMPNKGAVRIEEMINYFNYDYPQPEGDHPFSINTEVASCPWNSDHQLVQIGIQGKSLDYDNLKSSNLVFLIDASGSMDNENKLPLLKKSFRILLDQLSSKDRIAIVAYAGSAGLVLPSTPASEKEEIIEALDQLQAGGSTAGGEGIELAYKVAKENLILDGNNRVVLATDGDFNVGASSPDALVDLISEKRKDNIYLTICGLGMGNYKDNRMEQISNAGNGNYFYIDNIKEAQKVFEKEMRANMFTIAKDVKIQVEFNPNHVKSYRLIGYENRVMNDEDFDNDQKDAGELGAGHTVTALYEVVPANGTSSSKPLKYQKMVKSDRANSNELMTIKFRYKPIKSDKSILVEEIVRSNEMNISSSSNNLKFSASVAAFGMLLRDSDYIENFQYSDVKKMAKQALGNDENGYRNEFIHLVETAELLADK